MQPVQAFRIYGSIGMSAPSLHRESTDSVIVQNLLLHVDIIATCVSRLSHFQLYVILLYLTRKYLAFLALHAGV